MTDDLLFASATQQAQAIRDKRVSCVELVTWHLNRIEAVNPTLNAVVQLAAERALQEAEVADAALVRGERLGVLHGVPFTIKDSLDTAGIISTGGTVGRRDHVPTEDATAVARLRQAGGILLGKTNTPEFTMGNDTENDIYGRTYNPYDPTRSPAGSSGGAAAIVAAGGAALDLGSDTGGSIREPASACGVVGLKATAGRVPRTGHIVPYGLGAIDGLTHVGPLVRYAEDLALCLPLINGMDWRDPSVVPMAVPDFRAVDVKALRVAAHSDNGVATPMPEVIDTVESVIAVFSEHQIRVDRAIPPPVKGVTDLYQRLRDGDGGIALRGLLQNAGTDTPSPGFQNRLDRVTTLSTEDYARTLQDVDRFKSEMLQFMEDYDLLITPADVSPALPYDAPLSGDLYQIWSYSIPFNLTGWPAAVVRAGTSADGLPIGVQVVAPPWREDVVIAACQFIENTLGGYQRPSL